MIITCWPLRSRSAEDGWISLRTTISTAVSDIVTAIIDNHIDVNVEYRRLPDVCLVVQAP
jgi:hypothetical protein